MEENVSEKINKDNTASQQSYKVISDDNTENNYLSKMGEKEVSQWFKQLDLEEEITQKLADIIKNGNDLISLYSDKKILEKLNINLHANNIINSAIEEKLEEQLKINIALENEKNIILNIENEPKCKLKDILLYLEKLFGHPVFLTPASSPNEILTPNTLIVRKILLNPNKYCNLKIFDEKSVRSNYVTSVNKNLYDVNKQPLKSENILNDKNKKEFGALNNNNININKNLTPDINKDNSNINLNLDSNPNNINNNQISNLGKGYVSLFQNKKNILPDFTTDYKMPSQNRNNGNNNFIKLENKINTKPLEDFKYHNILSLKDNKEADKKNFFTNNNEPKTSDFPNINISEKDNLNNNNNNLSNLNKNYFTQRNFNMKNMQNDNINIINTNTNNNNNLMFQRILTKNKNEQNISDLMGNKSLDLKGEGENSSMLGGKKVELEKEKEKERDISIPFLNNNDKNNNEMKKIGNIKTENRYEFSRLQDFDKDLFTKNIFMPKAKTHQDNNNNDNDINNLIIKQNEELKNSKDKLDKFGLNLKEDSNNNILKVLKEKYSLENKDNLNDSDNNINNINNNRMIFDLKKEYKPKTPINEGRRIINNENFRFTNLTDDTSNNSNNNNPLENKFLSRQKDDFMQYNNLPNKNNAMIFNKNEDEDESNNYFNNFTGDEMNFELNKMNVNMNVNNNKIGKNNNRINRPSPGLEFNNFKCKTTGYKSSFPQNQENVLNNQFNQNDE